MCLLKSECTAQYSTVTLRIYSSGQYSLVLVEHAYFINVLQLRHNVLKYCTSHFRMFSIISIVGAK